MTSSVKAIICDEIFDENSLPSEQEVRDYAVRIGINPDTEKHLLNIALDGLMSPLPEDWKPCLDERIHRIYYYNVKTHQTQWTHPLDEHFENLVKRKRQEESISAGDDDSKTSIKEDLKSFEEALTTSDMMSSRNPLSTHKSRLTITPQKTSKDPLSEGLKTLNPVGRPPLPPKRISGSTSPKRGGLTGERSNLSLRLSSSPSPTRIDIDSIGIPMGLPSPETKSEKHPTSRSAIKLTGGGSAFLKSKQKQSSPSEESKKSPDEPIFEIVREAESLDSPEEGKLFNAKDSNERKLKHSVSLGESGFDKLTKSKQFESLQESLLSLKNEMAISSNEAKSPNTSAPLALRGILREKPSPTTKLWDIDPVLLTSEEKEALRIQELKEERKQNVRFADILNQPINIHFSKSDSEEDSNSNDSSNDLDDLILEQLNSDDELKPEIKVAENVQKPVVTADVCLTVNSDKSTKDVRSESNSVRKETNKNILSRLTDLNLDSGGRSVHRGNKRGIIESDNNNIKQNVDWLTDTQNILNENELKMKKEMLDNTQFGLDLENNTLDKNLSDLKLRNSESHKDYLQSNSHTGSPSKITQLTEVFNNAESKSSELSNNGTTNVNSKHVDLKRVSWEDNNDISSVKTTEELGRSKLMPEVDLQKVFESVRDSIIHSTEHSDVSEDMELMQTSPLSGENVHEALEENEEDLRRMNTGVIYRASDRLQEKCNKNQTRKFEEYKEQQRRLFEEKKASLHSEYEEMLKELQHQESLEKQRFYTEVQQSMSRYKEEIDIEKNEREAQLRNECEEYLKELEKMLAKDKELKVQKIKEEHEVFLKEQEKKIIEEKIQFEEETKLRLKTSSSQLEKIVAELKQKEENEIARLMEESNKNLNEERQRIELEQAEQEKRLKQELAIVDEEFERVLAEKRDQLENLRLERDTELGAVRLQNENAIKQLAEQHIHNIQQIQDQYHQEEEALRKKHSEKIDALNAQLRAAEKEDITQINREFEKVRCEKRLLEDKYKSLKEKYMRLKNEVRLSMERKRQAKLNRQLQQRETVSTTEDTTERSADHGKPPMARKKLVSTLSSDDTTGENAYGTPKTIKRRPKPQASMSTSSATVESSSIPPAKPKNVWNPSPHQRREGVSSAEDNHTSVSEEIQMEQDDSGGSEKWTQSVLSPLDNLRKQLEKLDDLEEQFPTSVHTDTYLRYPFSGPAGASCELDFYRHRLHLERESVRRAKQALAEQRLNIESRQMQLRHRQHTETLHQLNQEERELTDMEVSLHRTRALLGEKIIRLRFLEQSIERAASFTSHHSQDSTANTNTDSSGFSGSDLDLSNTGLCPSGRSENLWTENVLQSLENINSEIREIWTILGKQQVPGLGPPPLLNYENRAINQSGVDSCSLAPHRATDIADRTRRLKEWLIRTRDQQTQMIAPVTL